jgi:hypothetical protein
MEESGQRLVPWNGAEYHGLPWNDAECRGNGITEVFMNFVLHRG